MRKLLCLVAAVTLLVPVISIAEETTVTEKFNNQQINTDIEFIYGGNDTAITAATTQAPECASTEAAGSIGSVSYTHLTLPTNREV